MAVSLSRRSSLWLPPISSPTPGTNTSMLATCSRTSTITPHPRFTQLEDGEGLRGMVGFGEEKTWLKEGRRCVGLLRARCAGVVVSCCNVLADAPSCRRR
eukprot:221630-Rhodomonas_salina.1